MDMIDARLVYDIATWLMIFIGLGMSIYSMREASKSVPEFRSAQAVAEKAATEIQALEAEIERLKSAARTGQILRLQEHGRLQLIEDRALAEERAKKPWSNRERFLSVVEKKG